MTSPSLTRSPNEKPRQALSDLTGLLPWVEAHEEERRPSLPGLIVLPPQHSGCGSRLSSALNCLLTVLDPPWWGMVGGLLPVDGPSSLHVARCPAAS
jgi:hypothetical protein